MKTLFASIILMILVLNVQGQTKKTSAKPKAKAKSTATKSTITDATYLVGTWNLIQAPTGGIGMSQTWEFTKTEFVMSGYPKLDQKGMYTVIKQKSDTLALKFFHQEGDLGTEDKEQLIIIDKAQGQMSMGSLVFKRKE